MARDDRPGGDRADEGADQEDGRSEPGIRREVLAAPAGGGTADSLDQLEKLADLHARGALTDAEFAAEKAKILGSE